MNKLDKTISYYNIIMRCDKYVPEQIILPSGYNFRKYKDGDAEEWARLEVDVNDFDTFNNAVKYFNKKYLIYPDKLDKRFICVENSKGQVAGIVIAWFEDYGGERISALHWLVTSPNESGKGIGTALVKKLLELFNEYNEMPVYLHTQPWSYIAVGIYNKCGFRILKSDTFKGYQNQYSEAIKVLEKYMYPKQYKKLIKETI